jgi:hypothetical protein
VLCPVRCGPNGVRRRYAGIAAQLRRHHRAGARRRPNMTQEEEHQRRQAAHIQAMSDAELEARALLIPGSSEYRENGMVVAEQKRREREHQTNLAEQQLRIANAQADAANASARSTRRAMWAAWGSAAAAFLGLLWQIWQVWHALPAAH